MSIMLCPDADELKRFSLGQLAEPESSQLATHLSDCVSCQSELETVVDDSLVANLRAGEPQSSWEDEPACEIGILRSLGALSQLPVDTVGGEIPKQIGEYKIIRLLGRGGMGTVYLAHHTRLGRDVALKVLADHRLADSRARQRFESEMQAIGRLSHPGIVAAFDARDIENAAVIVTEFIDGMDLEELVRRVGPLSIADACEIVCRVAQTLQYTCDAGYVHRDVKPSNIMLSASGDVKLLDLGLARPEAIDSQMTGTGQAMGTADYIAPEQVTDGKSVDIRADIYSLGCTLFKLLTGGVLFDGDGHITAFAKMTAHVSNQPPKLSGLRSDAPASVIKLLSAMLAKLPGDRPSSPAEVANSLESFSKKADLEALIQVAEASKDSKASTPELTTEPTTASPGSFLNRCVPIWALVGTAAAALFLGILLGVVITITYPDGTVITLNAPDGSEISIEENTSITTDTASVAKSPRSVGAPIPYSGPRATSPLAFAVEFNSEEFDEIMARDKRDIAAGRRRRGSNIWLLPGYGEVLGRGSWRVHSNSEAQLLWSELIGHLSATKDAQKITLSFDNVAKEKLSEFLKTYRNRKIAIISFGRVVGVETFASSEIDSLTIELEAFRLDDADRLMGYIESGKVDSESVSTDNSSSLQPNSTASQLSDILAKAKLAVCVIAKEEDVAAGRGPAFQAFLKSKQALFPGGQKEVRPYSAAVGVYTPLLVPNSKVNQRVANAFGLRWAVIDSKPGYQFSEDLGESVSVQYNGQELQLSVDDAMQGKLDLFAKSHVGRQVALVSKGRIVSIHDLSSPTALREMTIDNSLTEQDVIELFNDVGVGLAELPHKSSAGNTSESSQKRSTSDASPMMLAPFKWTEYLFRNGVDPLNEEAELQADRLAGVLLEVAVIADRADVAGAVQSLTKAAPQDPNDAKPIGTSLGTFVPFGSGVDLTQAQVATGELHWALVEPDQKSRFEGNLILGGSATYSGSEMTLSFEDSVAAKLARFAEERVGRRIALISSGRILSIHEITSPNALRTLTIDSPGMKDMLPLVRRGRLVREAQNLQGVWLLESVFQADGGAEKHPSAMLASFVGNTWARSARDKVLQSGTFGYATALPGDVLLSDRTSGMTTESSVKFVSDLRLELTEGGQVLKFRRVDMPVDDLANQAFANPVTKSVLVEKMAVRAIELAQELLSE